MEVATFILILILAFILLFISIYLLFSSQFYKIPMTCIQRGTIALIVATVISIVIGVMLRPLVDLGTCTILFFTCGEIGNTVIYLVLVIAFIFLYYLSIREVIGGHCTDIKV